MEQINANDLYVACRVMKKKLLIEPFIQYDTFGDVLHTIIINPERILVYPYDDEFCVDAITGKPKKKVDYTKSFHTEASVFESVEADERFVGFSTEFQYMLDFFTNEDLESLEQVGYLMSFRDYIKQKLNIDIESVTLNQARLLLFAANLRKGKTIVLSENEEEAKIQIESLCGEKETKQKGN